MTAKKQTRKPRKVMANKPVSHGRHKYQCSICSHEQRAEIEEEFVNWVTPGRIAKFNRMSTAELGGDSRRA